MKLLALLVTAVGAGAQAPAFDSSGNKLLNGSDYFRFVAYTVADTSGDIGAAITLYGGISFDGNGNYSISGQGLDTGNGVVQNVSLTGTYTISASGYGYLTNPISSTPIYIYGLVSHGIFIGSSTEQNSLQRLVHRRSRGIDISGQFCFQWKLHRGVLRAKWQRSELAGRILSTHPQRLRESRHH